MLKLFSIGWFAFVGLGFLLMMVGLSQLGFWLLAAGAFMGFFGMFKSLP